MECTPAALLEAILFVEGGALKKSELAKLLEISPEMLSVASGALRDELLAGKRGVCVVETEDALELRSSASVAPFLQKLRATENARDIGKASLEALSILIYKGSATRGEIDWVRGVNSTTALRSLLLRGLVSAEEDPKDKRRMRYVPTPEALGHLGVTNASELPEYETLSVLLREREDVAKTSEVSDTHEASEHYATF
jgi:segregation and condensation protein B